MIIGEGEFDSVYKGFLIEPEKSRSAIKTLRDDHYPLNSREFLREASVMIHLKHHCIVQLIGISREETLMMVQEKNKCKLTFGMQRNFIYMSRRAGGHNFFLSKIEEIIFCLIFRFRASKALRRPFSSSSAASADVDGPSSMPTLASLYIQVTDKEKPIMQPKISYETLPISYK
uniref:Protein kinase domain-containing protein n=1 Tax=Glossina palpalis gambiensis TaxID=67801 RepID=A0A1B0B4C9_9MUSC